MHHFKATAPRLLHCYRQVILRKPLLLLLLLLKTTMMIPSFDSADKDKPWLDRENRKGNLIKKRKEKKMPAFFKFLIIYIHQAKVMKFLGSWVQGR
ncbi:hypothetical protein OIU84_017810 [Salix udensis]|uniref:Secreted protein n=1 Tax=Salix udensis TaxID=889485 RepID=A0AAD6L2W1_9ROSI|nr:hypothetical protein OIU84_017810 [Salix udensis]